MKIVIDLTQKNGLPTAKKMKGTLEAVLRKISFECYRRTILRTPVDTGLTRTSWQISGNGDSYKIANNQKHTTVLEYGLFRGQGKKITSKGFSTQAPEGMVGVTLDELKPLINKWIDDKL